MALANIVVIGGMIIYSVRARRKMLAGIEAAHLPPQAMAARLGISQRGHPASAGHSFTFNSCAAPPKPNLANRSKAWIAVGDYAIGLLVAFGGVAIGPISIGGLALGLLPFGGCALGLLSLGGMSIGLWSFGGLAIGWQALGGFALGWNGAMGGMAVAT